MQTFTRFEKFLLIDATFFRKILFKKCKKYTFAFLDVKFRLNGAVRLLVSFYVWDKRHNNCGSLLDCLVPIN